MARSKPNSGGGEGKTPLVIALVFFVLGTIVCGVLAYTFQGDIAAADAKAVEAKRIPKSPATSCQKSKTTSASTKSSSVWASKTIARSFPLRRIRMP